MAKKILVIDSGSATRDFFSLILSRWIKLGAELKLLTANNYWLAWSAENRGSLAACPNGNGLAMSWWQQWFWWWLKLRLLKMSWFGQCDAVILHNWQEKAMLSAWIKRLKLRLIWLEDGSVDYDRLPGEWRQKVVAASALAKVLVINEELVGNLNNLGYFSESLRLIPSCAWPPIDLDAQNLARHFKLRKDYFTICAKVDWQDSRMAESLIKSLQLCLEVSPRFQLVLLGQGAGREQIKWLIKRYHLETQVWLLGDRPQSERLLDGFAVVVVAGRRPDWDDLSLALTAGEKKITVMGREGTILRELLQAELGRVVEIDDQQALAQAWLDLYHNPPALPSYQKRHKELVSFEALADKLLAII